MIQDFLNVKDAASFAKALIVFFILIVINMFVVRFLWNTSLVKYITILKPVDTLFDTFLLSIALTIVQGRCMN